MYVLLTNPNNFTLTEKVHFEEKSTANVVIICHSLKRKFFPFLKSWLATILLKKDDKVGKKTANIEERQRKKESDRERSK